MANDHEIGRVVAVDTSQVTVELSRDLKALARSTYEGPSEVGSINSYIVIPVGARRIVAMVTRVMLSEESELKPEKTMVTLPSAKRLMKATMIGTIDENNYKQGINLFPVLDTPVYLTTRRDLNSIFGGTDSDKDVDPQEPGFCISIGRSVVFPDYDIKIDPDAFFGKHAAIIGSTGSGKSCSIATILQAVMEHPQVKQTRFVILDTNGEYRSAFQRQKNAGAWENAKPALKSLYIPADPSEKDHLAIPYWFMNSEDFIRLFKAAPGVQQPVLMNALSAARNSSDLTKSCLGFRSELIKECNRILGLCSGSDRNDARTVCQLCDGLLCYFADSRSTDIIQGLAEIYPLVDKQSLISCFDVVRGISREGIRDEGGKYEAFAVIDVDKRDRIENLIRPLLATLSRLPDEYASLCVVNADCPCFFERSEFRYRYLESAIARDDSNASRTRDACSTMLMRIYRFLEDSRFEFLFGPTDSEWPGVKNSLAAFLRDMLGMESGSAVGLTDPASFGEGSLPYYDRQRTNADSANVVIVDLSLLASEVLENVTALIGRLIHEFLQRLSGPESGVGRGEFPVVLVLEEAQNYIHENKKGDEESISKKVFERIAREGRKYGLGLVVASQRPSELSKTVLSQCNSFVVHRLQNPEDLRYFREIVPGIFGQLLDQLPALAPRSALVLGECIQAPALVEMRAVDPAPRSKNPKFFKSWATDSKKPDVEAVCARWEGFSQNDESELESEDDSASSNENDVG
ncbi:MAG: ATPase [Candidatus Riflebacteria bacterium HGW-Riflebacteria-1]|nr:MAG: ATPase [Candidatus Riflebacteria bacterium HGW-Riflebacteria-1]